MDYRNRRYFLVKFSYLSYDKWIKTIKKDIPSIKIHSPYSHFIGYFDKYDGQVIHEYVQHMISCRNEDILKFQKMMSIASYMDLAWYQEINKQICKQ